VLGDPIALAASPEMEIDTLFIPSKGLMVGRIQMHYKEKGPFTEDITTTTTKTKNKSRPLNFKFFTFLLGPDFLK
jgi:hypothetical protein